jgi:hypothetical protein
MNRVSGFGNRFSVLLFSLRLKLIYWKYYILSLGVSLAFGCLEIRCNYKSNFQIDFQKILKRACLCSKLFNARSNFPLLIFVIISAPIKTCFPRVSATLRTMVYQVCLQFTIEVQTVSVLCIR